MDPHNNYETSMNADASRPPQYCTCNIGCGCRQALGDDEQRSDAAAHRQYTDRLLRSIVQEQFMNGHDDISNDGRSLSDVDDCDEGLEDHQTGQHCSTADFGHDLRQHVAHHYICECNICPYRSESMVKEWLNYAVVGPETPESMYPEYGSSAEHSMASSTFLDTRPQTPGQLVVETGSVFGEALAGRYHGGGSHVTSPLWLVPERMMPHQLDICIPEESEPESEDEGV